MTAILPLEWKELWSAMEADYNAGGAMWFATTQEMHDEMLGVVPPRAVGAGAFLVGEPWTHNGQGQAVYACFRRHAGQFQARYMTRRDFREVIGR